MADSERQQKKAVPQPTESRRINQFVQRLLQHRKLLIMLTHVAVFIVAMGLAFLFVYNMQLQRRWVIYPYPILLIAALPIKFLVFGKFDQYRGWWRYVGMSDLLQIAKASLVSTIVLIVIWFCYGAYGSLILPKSLVDSVDQKIKNLEREILASVSTTEALPIRRQYENLKGLQGILDITRIPAIQKQINQLPFNSQEQIQLKNMETSYLQVQKSIESVLMLDLFTTIMLLSGLRMVIRLYHEEFFAETKGAARRFLIVGAGNAGEALLREMMRRKDIQYDAVGFIDDDPAKYRMIIHGIPVLGTVEQLPEICQKQAVDEIAIAMPSASRQQLRRVIQICQGTKLRFTTVPSITDIASGKLKVSQIREVDINDLLGQLNQCFYLGRIPEIVNFAIGNWVFNNQ